MPDKFCNYYFSKKIEKSKKINEVCVSPLRYGGQLEIEDIQELEKNYLCDCEDSKKCFWNSPKSRLEGFVKEK
ncbi:Uncharacterised protein [uncultured archaeon]|nr:Uncharacterised protein [uncultured archaeon]